MKTITSQNYTKIKSQQEVTIVKQSAIEDNPRFSGPYNPNRDNPMWPMNDLPRLRMTQSVFKELKYKLDFESMRESYQKLSTCIEELEQALETAGETIVTVQETAKKFDITEADVLSVINQNSTLRNFAEAIGELEDFLAKHCKNRNLRVLEQHPQQ